MKLEELFKVMPSYVHVNIVYEEDACSLVNGNELKEEIEDTPMFEAIRYEKVLALDFNSDFILVKITHKYKTIKEKFLEVFPNAPLMEGRPMLCVKKLGILGFEDECPCENCRRCWSRPYKEEEKWL